MPTIKDVAKEAGVSIATVSFYLNKKPVSEEKSKKIYEAIKKLNYIVNSPGRSLRTKSEDIGIILPNIYEPYYVKIINSLKGFLANQGKNFSLEISDDNPEAETRSLMSFLGKKTSGIILYSCQPDNNEIFEMLNSSSTPFVLIDRKPKNFDCNFVCCDNFNLFYILTDKLIKQGKKNLALVCGPQNYTENIFAYEGLMAAFEDNHITSDHSIIIYTRSIRENGFLAGIQLLMNFDNYPSAVLTTSYKLAEGLRYAFMINRINIGEDVTIITSGDSEDDVFFYDPTIIKTSRSAFEIGETAGVLLLQNIKSPIVFEKQQLIIKDTVDTNHLFENNPAVMKNVTAIQKYNETINILLPDDHKLTNALNRLLVDFYSKENISVKMQYMPTDNLHKYISENFHSSDTNIDVFLFDVPWLQHFVENDLLLCLDDFTESSLNTAQYVPDLLEYFSKVDEHYYSLPYVSSTQLLFYRKDLFNDKYVSRQYEDLYKIPLSVPKDWFQYSTVAKFFTQKFNSLSPVEYGHAMDIFNPQQLICKFLLPRLWSYGGDIYNKYGLPSFITTPAKKAVKNLLDCILSAHPDIYESPADAVDKLITGKIAMLIIFFNYATEIADRSQLSVVGKIGYSSIPGSIPAIGGWCLGIPKYSKHPEAAFKFIKWATSEDIAIPSTILGGQSPQLKAYRNYDLVSLYPWLSKSLSEFSKARKRQSFVKINHSKYSEEMVENILVNELKSLIQQTLSGIMPNADAIEKALSNAQAEVNKIIQ